MEAGVRDLRVRSWAELNEAVFEGSWRADLRRFRSRCAFRGVASAEYRLDTALARLGGDFSRMEGHLLRNFKKYARAAVRHDSFWNWVSLAQHHGLPTRLLDWTYSPFVAMHFATVDLELFDEDAAIWCVDFVESHALLPARLRHALDAEGSDVFTVEMLDRELPSLHELDRKVQAGLVLFFEPPSLDDRIVNQHALFSVQADVRTSLDPWLSQNPALARKVVIPKELKWEVRDKLDQANVTERVLFPGLDGLSSWLSRHYAPRPR
ncbi:MAG TPA: FRG domain-containing protein [Minicystis sp.]|nr:FRG domain-containing protein [Minicystis sp.]